MKENSQALYRYHARFDEAMPSVDARISLRIDAFNEDSVQITFQYHDLELTLGADPSFQNVQRRSYKIDYRSDLKAGATFAFHALRNPLVINEEYEDLDLNQREREQIYKLVDLLQGPLRAQMVEQIQGSLAEGLIDI